MIRFFKNLLKKFKKPLTKEEQLKLFKQAIIIQQEHERKALKEKRYS